MNPDRVNEATHTSTPYLLNEYGPRAPFQELLGLLEGAGQDVTGLLGRGGQPAGGRLGHDLWEIAVVVVRTMNWLSDTWEAETVSRQPVAEEATTTTQKAKGNNTCHIKKQLIKQTKTDK